MASSSRDPDKKFLEQERLRQEHGDTVWLMSEPEGRRVVRRILSEAGVYRSSYAGDATDTVFREGMRNLGLSVLNRVMTACPEQYLLMLKETENG